MTLINEITADELKDKIEANETINLIDVREQDEWESGHIPSARHIPLSEIQLRANEIHDAQGDVIIICRSGARSGRVCEFLRLQGFDVTNVSDGMLGWHGEVALGE